MAYPSIISTLATPQATDRLNSPSHSQLHQNENSGILEIQRFVGTDSSAVGTLVNDIRSPNSNGGGHIQTANKGGTGQTSYTKGDVLVAQSSSVLTKLAVGANGQSLVADSTQATGIKWGQPGVIPSMIAIGITSVYQVNSVHTYIKVQIIGAGGATNGNGGAGAGGYGESIIPVSSVVGSVLVTIGTKGSGSGDGGNSLFGNFIICQGGVGTGANAGGFGGSVIGAQAQVPGGRGQTATGTGFATGYGGVGFFGGGSTWGSGASPVQSAVGGYAIITEF